MLFKAISTLLFLFDSVACLLVRHFVATFYFNRTNTDCLSYCETYGRTNTSKSAKY
jgi:hypothetical protein